MPPKSNIPTPFMLKLKEAMIEKKKITESSALAYIANLVRLNDGPFSNIVFLKKNKDAILEHIAQFQPSTEANYLSSIVAALFVHKDSHIYISLYNFYKNLLNEKLDTADKEDEEKGDKMNDREKENWVSLAEIKEKWEELKEKVDKFKNNKGITKTQYETLLDFVIISV